MNTKFYEVDLLQKYRQTISKRYRGYNRIYQLNLNKFNQNISEVNQTNSIQTNIEIAQQYFESQPKCKNITNGIIIRSTNVQFNFKQINSEAEVNNKNFQKKKLMKQPNTQEEDEKTYINSPQQNQKLTEEYLENKSMFRNRHLKDPKIKNSDDGEKLIKNIEMIKFQPFSPIIKGQKKATLCMPNKKNYSDQKSKTSQNQTIFKQQENAKRSRNATDMETQKIIKHRQRLKRTNSYVSQKSDIQGTKQSLSGSVKAQKFIKKFSSNFQSKECLSEKPSDQLNKKASKSKVSFPKINGEKQSPKQTPKQTNAFNPLSQLEKNNQKYKKTPLLMKYQFDVKNVDSESYIVMEAQSEIILHGFRYNNPYEIASLTKIMTFYVVLKIIQLQKIDMRQQRIQVQHKPSNIGGTSADLFPGEIYTLQSLLYGLMLPSGNDAALTLAAWGGKFEALNPQDTEQCINQFVKSMNKAAKQLNLSDTRFGNPHGLPHAISRSTAYDIAKMCVICLKNNIFKKVVGAKSYKCVASTKDGKKRLNEWENTNKLLRRQGFIGIKTGITITAGPCLASAYNFKGKTYISVILRAKKISRRFKQTRKILHWCLSKLHEVNLREQDTAILKRLKRNNAQMDSDYSDEESIFCYDQLNNKQLRKRCNIISEM